MSTWVTGVPLPELEEFGRDFYAYGMVGVIVRWATDGMSIPPARIAKTIAFVQTVSAPQLDGTEEKEIVISRHDKETRFVGMQFLLGQALPNFYFHVTTAYAILRHNGVELGKRDYLGNP